jgi:hypothetical protein
VELGSPFTSKSQPGQVPLYRTRQGLMPPGQIRTRWFQASFLGNPWREIRMAWCQPTQMGVKETSRLRLRFEA